jgi:hypothetical protein
MIKATTYKVRLRLGTQLACIFRHADRNLPLPGVNLPVGVPCSLTKNLTAQLVQQRYTLLP